MNLEGKEFTPEKIKKAKADYESEIGENPDGILFCVDNGDTTRIDEIDDEGVIHVVSESSYGYVSVDVKMDTDDLIRMVEITVKKLNKFKSLLESLKG